MKKEILKKGRAERLRYQYSEAPGVEVVRVGIEPLGKKKTTKGKGKGK